MGSRLPASTPQFVQGDNVAVEIHLVTVSSSFSNPTPETAIPETAAVYIAVGIPGSTPVAQASLTTALANNLGRTGSISLNTAEVASLLGSSASADATFEGEMTEADGTVTTLFRVPCKVLNDLIEAGGAAPAAVPSIVADIADMRGDIDALRGGVPLANAWENPMDSAFFEAGNITITDGVPTALYGTGPINLVANALPDWQPGTIDISGVLQAGTAANCTAFFTFLDATGNEVLSPSGRLAVTISGAGNGEFSIVSASVPAGATRLAFGYSVIDYHQPCEFDSGFAALSVTAHAALSVLTAEALDAILADKAQAEADAGTITALVTPAQTNAQTIADLVAPAQTNASAAGTAKADAEASAAAAAAAVANMAVAPLGALASDVQVVRGVQFRSFNTISHQGCPTTQNGTPRSSNSDKGGFVMLSPAANTTDWCEARGRWGSDNDSFWQGWRILATNKPFNIVVGVRVLSVNANSATAAYFLLGDPVAITTPGALTSKGLGFKVALDMTAGNPYTVTPMWRKTGDGSTQSGTSASFARSDNYEAYFRPLRLYIEGDGAGKITFGYFNNGTRVPIYTLTGAAFTSNMLYGQFAVQCRHTAGSTLDAIWLFDKCSTITRASL